MAFKKSYTGLAVFQFFNPTKLMRIETDMSDLAVGACLLQLGNNGGWHPMAYYSRKMFSAEQNYNIGDKELLIIIIILKKWYIYILKELSTPQSIQIIKTFYYSL